MANARYPRDNMDATTDPTASDDESLFYGPFSRWFNSSTKSLWYCVDASSGAAVWTNVASVPVYHPDDDGLGADMYVLADAGFGLHDGRFIKHGYNVFGMVQRGPGPLPTSALHRANGDIETLCSAGRFPAGLELEQGFDGRIPAVNWTWIREPTEDLTAALAKALPKTADLPEEAE